MGGIDPARLARTLRAAAEADVHDDPGTLALYCTDASNYRVVPDLVVLPRTTEALVAVLATARSAQAPVAMRGAGTSVAGNALGGVVVDTSRHLNRILDLSPGAGTAVVEPGVVLADLQRAAAAHGLCFGADPSSASRATLGGMIANNACGAHSLAWGTTADNVVALDIVTGRGERTTVHRPGSNGAARHSGASAAARLERELGELGARHELLIRRRFGTFSRQISGYPLQHLLPGGAAADHLGPDIARFLSGTEGTLAATVRATLALTPLPAARVLLVLGFPNAVAAADSVAVAREHRPLTMESLNAALLERVPAATRRAARRAGLPEAAMWLLLEVGGEDPPAARRRAEELAAAMHDATAVTSSAIVTEPGAQGTLWRCRADSTGLATRRSDGAEAWPGWEDAAVPPDRLGTYLRGLEELLGRFGYSAASFGHFGEGCLHLRIDFDLLTEAGVRRYRSFAEEATGLVVSLGGSVSGEHGDGRARSALLSRMYGSDAVAVFDEVKDVFDPDRLLNPHVVTDPLPLDASLRHRGAARHRDPATVLAYPQDRDSFAQAQRRCVGVGNCRQSSGGVMCPSYQVTKEERHSTRGRAHLLWEMLEGDVVADGWRSAEVREALELCLSCKGCLSDCPVNVDMATYKTEFLHHHYAGRPWARPRSHWSLGWLPMWLRLASLAPGVANAVGRSRVWPRLAPGVGIDADRRIPPLAGRPVRRSELRAASRTAAAGMHGPAAGAAGEPVLLWPDTFTRYLGPDVLRAAVTVLEDAGFAVRLPTRPVCCGLTWMSTGQPRMAARVLRRSLAVIGEELDAGIPLVGLEPSCAAALRHDGPRLLPDEPRAAAAARATRTLAEHLADRAPRWRPPQLGGRALVQVHCHQHAVFGFDADMALLAAAGVDVERPDSGCCGMAGNFGVEPGHVELSRSVGERVLLPRVRAASPHTAVLADGFSCRTQISQETDRSAIHLAQLLAAGVRREA